MSAVTFDTLKFVETLEAARMPGEQARAIAAAVRDVQVSAEVATKDDVRGLDTKTEAAIARLETKVARLDAKMDMLKWMLALVLALVTLPLIKSLF